LKTRTRHTLKKRQPHHLRSKTEPICCKTSASFPLPPGAKSADAMGKPSGKQTFGLLCRRHVRVERIIYIGKESNRLEEIEAGLVHSPESVYTEYPDPGRDEWQTRILPILKNIPIPALIRVSGKSRSMLRRALTGQSTPRKRNQQLLKSILQRLGVV
jgi:hypothetical protein